jgi:predicted nucleotidyltransferase
MMATASRSARRQLKASLPLRRPPGLPLTDELVTQVSQALEGFQVVSLRVSGSHAYGTQRPDSDLDLRGIYQAPTDELFRLRPVQEQVERKDPDLVVFEVGKYIKMATGANPNILEQLYAPELLPTERGQLIAAHRSLFLSRRIRQTYGGYAMQQLRHALSGTGGSRGQAHLRREKFILHLFRLLEQGTQFLEQGEITLPISDPDRLREQARWPLERVEREFYRLDQAMADAAERSPLPEQPDYEAVDRLLIELRHL